MCEPVMYSDVMVSRKLDAELLTRRLKNFGREELPLACGLTFLGFKTFYIYKNLYLHIKGKAKNAIGLL